MEERMVTAQSDWGKHWNPSRKNQFLDSESNPVIPILNAQVLVTRL
jgi:hypothetical protein